MRKRVLLVFGTRPEAIKMVPLVKELQRRHHLFDTAVCVTGQHREMLDQVLHLFDVVPDYDLNIMMKGQDLYDVTSRILTGMREVLDEARPDVVLVHGDTTTSMAAALSAFYLQIPVGHVEAGLRTHNIYSPWPEEMNRQITGRLCTYHFAPTQKSRDNLLKEGVSDKNIFITGNTVIDALQLVLKRISSYGDLRDKVNATLNEKGLPEYITRSFSVNGSLADFSNSPRLVLITGHRRENFGDGFLHICSAVKTLTEKYPDVIFVYPMHLNPNVRKPIREIFGNEFVSSAAAKRRDRTNLFFIEPLDYLPFVYLMGNSTLVLTDSGGIQEEAPSLGKPTLVMRDSTERPEALEAGTVKLVGTNYDQIVAEVSNLLDNQAYYETMSRAVNPYGDGAASVRIVNHLSENL